MLFFLNSDGTMTRQDSTRIFQGSNNVTEIQVISQFSSATALQVAFTLPNGITTIYFPMQYRGEYVIKMPDGASATTGVYYHSYALSRSITEAQGTVRVSVNAVSLKENGQTILNNLTSYSASFEVEYSVLPEPPMPDPSPSETQELIDLLNLYYEQNAAILDQSSKDIASLKADITRIDGAIVEINSDIQRLNSSTDALDERTTALETVTAKQSRELAQHSERLSVVEQKTAEPLMLDFTTNMEEGTATKFYNDGKSQTIPLPSGGGGGNRISFLTSYEFTEDEWTAQEDGSYELSLTPEQSGRTNNRFLCNIFLKSNTEEKQLADQIIKGTDGSIKLQGVITPYAGRILTIAAGGKATLWYYGTLVTGEGTQIVDDEQLRAVASEGDFYLNAVTDEVYVCKSVSASNSVWEYIASLKGDKGVGVVNATAGEAIQDGDYTVTPIIFSFTEGIPQTINIKAQNGIVGVTSLNGMKGDVIIDKSTVGLSNVDNTSDLNKPLSAATIDALNVKASQSDLTEHTSNKSNPHAVTKTQVGLGSVDNTPDSDKPLSTAQSAAIAAVQGDLDAHKADVSNPHDVKKEQVGLGNVTNDSQVKRSEMGVANGVATLDANGTVPLTQINDAVLGQVEYLGQWDAATGVVSGTDLRTPAGRAYRKGDYYISASAGNKVPKVDGSAGFIVSGLHWEIGDWLIFTSGSEAAAWEKVDNTDAVVSVNGRTGAVVITSDDVGLGNVDNTSDADKPISGATQTALNQKANAAALNGHIENKANPHSVTKSQIGLSEADNTSDSDKPISTATQAALDLKADLNALSSEITARQEADATLTASVGAAQSAAVEAQSAANTAQGTADTALSVAQDAQSTANSSVQIVAQNLTDAQKEQARANIGAAASGGATLKTALFTITDWVQQSDGSYNLTLEASQIGRVNNLYVANIEKTEETGQAVLADRFYKGANGSITVVGVLTPYAGRIITISV